jgi:uncharacterized ferritin-like protein (DUF455 family)
VNIKYGTSYEWAHRVLTEPNPNEKVTLTLKGEYLSSATPSNSEEIVAPNRPARPERPILLPPREMPKRSTGKNGIIAFVHALAHIELNAIDLAWDMILRFGQTIGHRTFFRDWISVAQDEAKHFQLLTQRLEELGSSYGDLPAHDGLWEAATKTSHDVLDRLAVIPMMLEARGIDTTPKAMSRLRGSGDLKTYAVLEEIYADEIEHLRIGVRWFEHVCAERKLTPVLTWRAAVKRHLNTKPKEPINVEGRHNAAMNSAYWDNW